MTQTIRELHAKSDEELVAKHDELTNQTIVGTRHYLDELQRRDNDRATR
jgi:hypothetical protein